MQVKEIMLKEIVKVKRSTTLKELLRIFSKFHIFPLVPVVGEDGRLTGIVSFRNLIDVFKPYHADLVRMAQFVDEEDGDIFKADLTEEMGHLVIVDDIMERNFISVREDATLEEAYQTAKLYLKEELPVIDGSGILTGIIGIFDIIREAFRQKGIVG